MTDNETKIAEIFNEYFVNIVRNLGIFTEKGKYNFYSK